MSKIIKWFKNLKYLIKAEVRYSFRRAFLDTFYISTFTFFPTLGAMLILKIQGKPLLFESYYKADEFFLYAISFLSSSYLIYNQLTFDKKDLRKELAVLMFLLILLTSFCYSIDRIIPKANIIFLNKLSGFLVILSIIAFYYSQYLTAIRSPDIGDIRRDEQQEIMDNLIR